MIRAQLLQGDCFESLIWMPDDSIDSCVTDPPYAINFMGKRWDTGEVAFSLGFWQQVFRVLKPGSYLAAFSATRTYHRMACAIEDAGFDVRDQLAWVYGTGFPKSMNVSKAIDKAAGAERTEVIGSKLGRPGMAKDGSNQRNGFDSAFGGEASGVMSTDITAPATDAARKWDGWGTALKPAWEPIVFARKPLSESTVAANVLQHGTGALNIDGCRVDSKPRKTGTKASGDEPTGTGSTLRGSSLTRQQEYDLKDAGRFPANLVHDGSDEVLAAFPESSNSGNTNSINGGDGGIWQASSGKPVGPIYNDKTGSAARFFYSAKANKTDRAGSKHPTVKPVALMRWLTRLVTPPDGIVLDPFAGSGTTGAACVAESFNVILCERESEYVADIKRRFKQLKIALEVKL